jgi:hypothetical protein
MHTAKGVGLTLLMCTSLLITAPRADDIVGGAMQTAPHSAIVRLQIPLQRYDGGQRHHVTEHCSGTLVDPATGMILTAWH